MLTVIALTVLVVVLTWLVVSWRREPIEAAYERGDQQRKLLTAVAVIVVAWTFIRSGDPWLMVLAVVGIAFATLYFAIEQPHKEVV